MKTRSFPSSSRFLASPLHEVFRRVQELEHIGGPRRVLPLHVGEPGFRPPDEAGEALARCQRDGKSTYCDAEGLPSLRAALAHKVASENRIALHRDQIIVTPGSTQGLFALLTALAEPGDAVLLPRPFWPLYLQQCAALGLRTLFYDVSATGEVDFDQLSQLLAGSPALLLVNTPANPTGVILEHGTLERLLQCAARAGVPVLSDEAYEDFAFDRTHHSPAALDSDARVFTTFSFSKTFALTGLRVGYIVCPDSDAALLLARVQQACLVCPCTPAQVAAEAALGIRPCAVESARAHLARAREMVEPTLRKLGLVDAMPMGGWYAYCRVPWSGISEQDYVRVLLDDYGVGVAPGAPFRGLQDGRSAWNASFRIALCGDLTDLEEGMRRILASAEVAQRGEAR